MSSTFDVDRSGTTALNRLCPYFTMFPLRFPYGILRRRAAVPDAVLDPFCGRGTTNYAARFLGLSSYGFDVNPVACAIATAKAQPVTAAAIVEEYDRLLSATSVVHGPTGEFWQWAFHPLVLGILVRLRHALEKAQASPAGMALRGIILGALHGPRNKNTDSYFSNQNPRTYAPKPDYAVRYWRERDLQPPCVNVRQIIERRAVRYYGFERGRGQSVIIQGDARDPTTLACVTEPVRWIITSPPYYGMRTYLADQWLRGWFLGGPANPAYRDPQQLRHNAPEVFAKDLCTVWRNVRAVSTEDARLVIRFGGITDRTADPREILSASLVDSGWRVATRRRAGFAPKARRQADHFQRRHTAPMEEFDLWSVAC